MKELDSHLTLLEILPKYVSDWIYGIPDVELSTLIELTVDLKRPVSARFADGSTFRSPFYVDEKCIKTILNSRRLGKFQTDDRACIEGTLHRISRIVDRDGDTIGLTMRVGRIIEQPIELFADLLDSGKSIILIGIPGAGKTSNLRMFARYLADAAEKRVVIVDSSNEIAGEGLVPHSAVGMSRRLMVPDRAKQFNVMMAAVANHSPEVVIVDELSNRQEAEACSYIAERGVQLLASVHGKTLEDVVGNKHVNDIVGRVDHAAVSDKNVDENGGSKFAVGRIYKPPFDIAIEIVDFTHINVYNDVQRAVDAITRGDTYKPEARWVDPDGKVHTTNELYIKRVEQEPKTPMADAFEKAAKSRKSR